MPDLDFLHKKIIKTHKTVASFIRFLKILDQKQRVLKSVQKFLAV